MILRPLTKTAEPDLVVTCCMTILIKYCLYYTGDVTNHTSMLYFI